MCTYLGQEISQSPTDQRGHGLGDERLVVESIVVGGPSWNGSSACDGRIAKERAGGGHGVLGEFRLDSANRFGVDLFGQRGTARIDAKGADGQKGRGNDEKGCKLHGGDDDR